MKFRILLTIAGLLLATPAMAAINECRVTGSFSAWSTTETMITLGASGPDNNIWRGTALVTGGAQTWKFVANTWTDQWSNGAAYTLNAIQAATYGGGGGGDPGNYTTTFTTGRYYTFRFKDNNWASTSMTVLETNNNPISLTAVNSPDTSAVYAMQKVRVNVTLSAAKSAQENIVIRYTTNGWATSDTVLCDSTAATAYYADIPGVASGTKVVFYVLSTTVFTSSDWDLQTLAYNNNGGANFTYTVRPPTKTYHVIYPPTGVYVTGGGSRQFGDSELIRTTAGATAFLTWDTTNLYFAFAGGTGNTDKYNVLIDTDPRNPSGATDTFSGRGLWDTLARPDVAYQIASSAVNRFIHTGATWGGATNVTATCTTYFAYDSGGTEDTIVIGIPRSNFGAATTTDSMSFYIYASSAADVLWANFDNTPSGLDFRMTDSQMVVNDTTAPSAPTALTVYPTRSATDSFTLSWTAPSDPTGVFGYYYKISSAPTFDTDGTLVRTTSVAGVSAGGSVGFDSVYVWAVDRNNNALSTNRVASTDSLTQLNLRAEDVVINEILAVDKTALSTVDSFAFIELYNKGTAAVDISGWTITDYTTTWTIPGATTLAAGQFLVQHMKTGINYTDSYGAIHIFPGANTTIAPGGSALNSYGLYRGATQDSTTINDFVCVSTNPTGSTVNDSHAFDYGIWLNDTVVRVTTYTGISVVRTFVDGTDSDLPVNWDGTSTAPTWSPGFANGAGNRTTIGNMGDTLLAFKAANYTTDTNEAWLGDTVYLKVNVTTSPGNSYIDNIPVVVRSSNDTIIVVLRETAIASKIFQGHFRIVAAMSKRDNELYVIPQDIVYCTTVVGGCTALYGSDADSLYVKMSPIAPTAISERMTRAANGAETIALLAGDTIRLHTSFDDPNGADELNRGAMYVAIRKSASESIVLKLETGVVAIMSGSDTLYPTVSVETAVIGTAIRCTWTMTLRWNWDPAGTFTLSSRAVDSTGLGSGWTDSPAAFYYIRQLAFSGALLGNGIYNDTVTANKYFRGGETVTWSGLTAVYLGTNVSPPSDNYFDILITNDNGTSATQTASSILSTPFIVDTTTDLTEQDTVTLIGLQTGATFADTRSSSVFGVDADLPVITLNRDSYTFKGTGTDSYGAIFDIDFSDALQQIDTAWVYRGSDTQVITSYGSTATNWRLAPAIFNALSNGVNILFVEATDSSGNRSTKSIYVAKEAITIDGSLADWQADEDIGLRGGRTFYTAWDDTYLYLALANQDLDAGDGGDDGDFQVYINFKTCTEGTTTPDAWDGIPGHTLPQKFQWAVEIEDGTYDNLRKNITGVWTANQESVDPYWKVYSGNAATPRTEIQIAWTEFDLAGRPDTMDIFALRKSEGDSRIWQSFPVTGLAPGDSYFPLAFTDRFTFNAMRDTVAPDSQALTWQIQISPTTVTVGAPFTLTVAAVNSRGETLQGINSPMTITVSAGTLGVSNLTLVNGKATIADSITNANGLLTVRAISSNNAVESGSATITVNADIVYGWHAAGLNRPDTGVADADSFMRTVNRDGVDTMWPRRRTTDNPVIFWLGKANDTFATSTFWYKTVGGAWASLNASETRIVGTDSFYRFDLSQAAAAGWDYGDTISYYFRIIQSGKETTYIHGTNVIDNVTDSAAAIGEAIARANPFIYRIRSTAPLAPDTAISPANGQTNVATRNPTLTWVAGVDIDTPAGDTISDYFFEIASTPGMTDTASYAADIGWQGSGATSHVCSTTLAPFTWYYWRVKARDTNGFESAFSETFRFQINAIIGIDAILSDWQTGELIPTINTGNVALATKIGVTWDSTTLFVSWDKKEALHDSDVLWFYIDSINGGSSTSYNWGGTHTLPFSADTGFHYEAGANKLEYWRFSGGTWNWIGAIGSRAQHIVNGIVEISVPWTTIGTPDSFRIVAYIFNQLAGTHSIYSIVPVANRTGAASQNLTAYLEYPRVFSGITPNSKIYFKSTRTWQAPKPTPGSFSPNIDGVMDLGWGTVATESSTGYKAPNPGAGDTIIIVPAGGTARDVYVTNDAQWLYIGWQAFGDPYAVDVNLAQQSANYGFAITDTSSWGSPYDPWKTAGTTRVTGYGANVWVNGYANFGVTAFTAMTKYISNGATWDAGTSLTSADFSTQLPDLGSGWGEFRVPLSQISSTLRPGDTIGIIHFARHDGSKIGIDDATPYDSIATSNYSVSAAGMEFRDTLVLTYVIKQGVIDALHIPESTPVVGTRKMRTPPAPTVADRVNLLVRANPTGVLTDAFAMYSLDTGATWNSVQLASEIQSGGMEYWSGLLPTIVKDSNVRYYFRLLSDQMTTYVYGSDTSSNNTSSEITARAGAYNFTIANTAPGVPSTIEVTPRVPTTNDTITAEASGATDSNVSDILTYRFEWRKNSVVALTTYDAVAPFRSEVPPASTAAGESWQVFVSVGDGRETTALVEGPSAVVSTIANWPGVLPTRINTSKVVTTGNVTEWIRLDKSNDARYERQDVDLREVRLQADTNYVYLLFRLGNLSIGSGATHLAIAIDTTPLGAAGGNEIGDQTNALLGAGITTPALRQDRQIIIHSTASGSLSVEIDIGAGAPNWIAPPSGFLLETSPAAGVIEARLSRSDLQLAGASTFRMAIAAFTNVIGSAASIDATSLQPTTDAMDALSMPAVTMNDTNLTLVSWDEDLSDGDLDLWFQLTLSDTSLVFNSPPSAMSLQIPGPSDTQTDNPPDFTWGLPTDTDVNDTVVAYLFELADSGVSLDGQILYRVVSLTQNYTPPTFLTDSSYYTWRARAIDRAGNIGTAASRTFFLRNQTSILVNSPTDLQNFNNMRRMNGDEVAETSVRWNWVAAIHSDSAPIVAYVIQIDTSTNFSSPVDSITLSSTSRIYTWPSAQRGKTYYARLLAVDTGGFVDTSPASDGIYVSRREVNGDSSDWAPTGGLPNDTVTLNTTFAEGIWTDSANDQRSDVANSTSRDMLQFQVTADPFNIYFLVPTQAFVDGWTIGEIAISFDDSSDNRSLQGNGIYAEDSFTTTKWAWERLVRWRTGNDDCYALNTAYAGTPARYTEHTGQKFVELCVPLSALGGADNFLGRPVSFTVATFYNNSGAVGTNGAGNSNAVDVITNAASTWTDVSDQVINYAVTATFDTDGRVTAFVGTPEASSYAPPLPGQNGEVQQVERDLIMYNVFVDRFVNGRSDNAPGDPNMTGGDLQGLMDSMSYFNTMGFNCIYTSPLADFGGGAWGYNQNDLYGLQHSFSDPNSKWRRLQTFVELAKKARNHNIKIAMDWVPGQIAIGPTLTKYPEIVASLSTEAQYQRFGSQRVKEYSADARQFFVDQSLTWAAMGAVGLRADNTKFYQPNDDPPNGLPFYRYMRKKWDQVYPAIYVFGEQPGSAGDISGYVNDGTRMDGQLDFPIRENINSWVNGGTTANLITGFTGNEASYGSGVMAGFIENHDHSRTYHNMGGGGDNDGFKNAGVMARMRAAYMFSSLHSQPVVFFYGDEVPISGWNSGTYPFPPAEFGVGTEKQGQTRAMPWNWPDGTWLRDHLADYFTARCIFPEMRGSNGNRDLSNQDANNSLFRYRRGTGDQQRVVGYINKSGGDIAGITNQVEAGGTFRDWIHPGDAGIGPSFVTNIPDNGRLWVQAGFGRYSLHVDAGEPGVIVTVDNNTAWTGITGADGKVWINRVMTAEFGGAGTENRTLYWWKPGYTVHSRNIHLTVRSGQGADIDTTVAFTTPDVTGPPAPSGLAGVSRNHAAWLRWEPVYDYSSEDPQSNITYKIYRSTTPNNPSAEWIMETLQPWFYDNNGAQLLTNGDTYYYRVVACDRNGNPSGYSNEVTVVPNTITVKFYFTTEGTGWSSVSNPTVKIGGNVIALGDWAAVAMTALDTGMWYFECQMDPEIMPEYKFVVNDEWEWNNIFYSNDVSYERHSRPRLITIVDHTGDRVAVFTNKWNVDGDVAPRQVQNAVATGGDTFISIGWTPNLEADVNRYIIRRSPDGAAWTEIGDAAISQNTFTDTAVSPATPYYYQVKAVDWWNQGGSWSGTTSAQLVSADVTAPAKPMGLAAAPVDTGSIFLSWTPNSDGDMAGYYLYRSTDPSVPATLGNRVSPSIIGASLSPSYTDTGVTNGVQYYYKLAAVDYAGNTSTPSDTLPIYIVAVRFELDLAVAVPSTVEISGSASSLGASPTRVTLPYLGGTLWGKTFGLFAGVAVTYKYSYNSGATVERDFATSSLKREYTPPVIASITRSEDWENAPIGPSAPTGYAGNQTAYLAWTADSGVDVIGYYIERASASDSVFRSITPTSTANTYYVDTGRTNGETYYYIIRSADGGTIELTSPASRTIVITPQPPVWIRFRVEADRPKRWITMR